MSANHGHGPADDGAMDLRLWVSAVLNIAITLAEFAGGVISGSIALMADAAHNLNDVAAVLLALWARRFGRRRPTTRHTYGFKRVEVLAALANSVVLIGLTVLIARAALERLLNPEPVSQGIMLAVALSALLGNVGSVVLLRKHDRHDLNVRSAFLHMAQDALASQAVVVAALLAHTSVGPFVDPAAALIIGIVILRSTVALVWESVSTFLEGVPADLDLEIVVDRVNRAFTPSRLHHVHIWENGPGQRLLTAHVSVTGDMDARAVEALLSRIKAFLLSEWAVSHATLEPEVGGCGNSDVLGEWADEGTGSGKESS